MRIAVIGATGFIGQALITSLIETTNHQVIGFSKSATKLIDRINNKRFDAVAGDLFDESALRQALDGCDMAYYLVHMMGASHDDYAKLEAKGAQVFAQAARQAGVKRVIFLGGLGDSDSKLSKHLKSRQRSGEILRSQLPLVLEFRASMIVGDGSVGYEIIKAIANDSPVTAVPNWADTATQPIALSDMLKYLVAAIDVPLERSEIIEVGGPEVLTYPQILSRYTAWQGHKQHVFKVYGVPRWAATFWLNRYVSDKAAGIGKPMVDSLHNPMVVTDDKARQLFPAIITEPIEAAFTD